MEIKSIQLGYDQKTLLVATNAGDILELATKDAKINVNSKFALSKTLMKSHSSPNKRSLNEIWGLAVNPQDSDQFYTCGDDATLRSWSISQKKMLNCVKTNLDQYQNEIKPDEFGEMPDNTKGRCIAVSQNGIQICVGFKDGTVRVSYNLILRSMTKSSSNNQSIAQPRSGLVTSNSAVILHCWHSAPMIVLYTSTNSQR